MSTSSQLSKGVMSTHLVHEGFKSGLWLNSYTVAYFFNVKVT